MFDKVTVPADGKKIEIKGDKLVVPDNPILGIMWGDGIGPDITRASLRIWDAAVQKTYGGNRKVAWMRLYAGEEAMAMYNDPLPPDTLKACQELIVSIKGPLTTPVGGGFRSLNVSLRQLLDLYACVRPVRWYPGIPSPLREPHKVDIVIFRENTEDVYMGIEWPSGSKEAVKAIRLLNENLGTHISEAAGLGIKPITEFGTKRLVRKAIRYALDHGRKSVALMHKGNIQKYTEGAFMKWGYELAQQEFGDVTITEQEAGGKTQEGKLIIKDRIADIMFQQMLLRPDEYDVIATPNLNGDYLSDAVAAEVGGVGIAPGANIADFVAVFEATHGTAPKYTNLDKMNPGSLLLSGVMMLEYIGWNEAARAIVDAYVKTVGQKIVTYDFARLMEGAKEVKTSEFASAVIVNLQERAMDEEKRVNEPSATYAALPDQVVSKPVILERGGKPVLVLMPYEEYQRLQQIERDAQVRRELAQRDLKAVMDKIRSLPTDLTEEQIEAIVTEEVQAVREERRARHRAMGAAQSSILELQGLGKETWQNIDVQAYIDQERASWNG